MRATGFNHVSIHADDLEESVRFYVDVFGMEKIPTYELPDGSVQMYIRDPAGNLVEIDWPDSTTLDRSTLPELKRLGDPVAQTGDALRATLYLDRATP